MLLATLPERHRHTHTFLSPVSCLTQTHTIKYIDGMSDFALRFFSLFTVDPFDAVMS